MRFTNLQRFAVQAVFVLSACVRLLAADEPIVRVVQGTANKATVNTNVVRFFVEPDSRQPHSIAVVLNRTSDAVFDRFTDVKFIPFQSEFLVTLDPRLKRHNVSVGTISGKDKYARWTEVPIFITNLPPVVVITNPTSNTTSVALLQLQGFADESLDSITYIFQKGDGSIEKGEGHVSRRETHFRSLATTRAYFQCVDLELERGTNRVQVRCQDQYGNITTTNLVVVLDLDSDKTPPTIEIITPQPNERVSASVFAIAATLDDPSAKLGGEIAADGKRAKLYPIAMDRNGGSGFNNVPVLGETNFITLVATDQAGNRSETNFTVFRGNYSLVRNEIAPGEWSKPIMTLTGTITGRGNAIWVNGVWATINSDGTWSAIVARPRPEAFPQFVFKVIPLSEVPNTNTQQ